MLNKVSRILGWLCGVLVLAHAAHAEEPAAPPNLGDIVSMRAPGPDDIVVTGHAQGSDRQVERQARAISRVNGSMLRTPLARFHARVCPGISGLPREMAELIVDRIRFNAERVGIPVAKEDGCSPNIVVAFARDGRGALQTLTRTQGYLFEDLTVAEVKELLADPGPVHAWTHTAVRSRFGDQMVGQPTLVNPPTVKVQNSHSHIFQATRLDIESAQMVIDLPAIDGLSINQIADYATMRSFARTRPVNGRTASDTILSLFDPDTAPPGELTEFDLAYLKSLYGSYDSLPAIHTIVATRREIGKEPPASDAARD